MSVRCGPPDALQRFAYKKRDGSDFLEREVKCVAEQGMFSVRFSDAFGGLTEEQLEAFLDLPPRAMISK